MYKTIGKDLKGGGLGLFLGTGAAFSGETEYNNEQFQPGKPKRYRFISLPGSKYRVSKFTKNK
jgi:hypothetical protein